MHFNFFYVNENVNNSSSILLFLFFLVKNEYILAMDLTTKQSQNLISQMLSWELDKPSLNSSS